MSGCKLILPRRFPCFLKYQDKLWKFQKEPITPSKYFPGYFFKYKDTSGLMNVGTLPYICVNLVHYNEPMNPSCYCVTSLRVTYP